MAGMLYVDIKDVANTTGARIGTMAAIFVVSLLAVTFPALSKRVRFVQIPKMAFFLGKHFGTGVILSTAFCHLLQDSFESLRSPEVKERHPEVGEKTGFIILGSLLLIFFVEYLSSAYVDHLHDHATAPDSSSDEPKPAPTSSSSSSSVPTIRPAPPTQRASTPGGMVPLTERSSLIPAQSSLRRASMPGTSFVTPSSFASSMPVPPHTASTSAYPQQQQSRPRAPDHSSQMHTHPSTPETANLKSNASYLSDLLTNSPRFNRSSSYAEPFYMIQDLGHHLRAGNWLVHRHDSSDGHNGHEHGSPPGAGGGTSGVRRGTTTRGEGDGENFVCVAVCKSGCPLVKGGTGVKKVVPLLAPLESADEGSEAEISEGEGVSLLSERSLEGGSHSETGLAPMSIQSSDGDEGTSVDRQERRRAIVRILVLQLGIMIHSLVIGLTLAVTRGSEFASLLTAITFHQLFEGLSLGIRIDSIPPPPSPSSSSNTRLKKRRPTKFLPPVLSILFALTTPLGMGIGLIAFHSRSSKTNAGDLEERERLLLIQGLMSAISAGMLVYASCVEMLGGDFVFGTVSVSGHGHSHGGGGSQDKDEDEKQGENSDGMRDKILAVGSLLAGVVAMGML